MVLEGAFSSTDGALYHHYLPYTLELSIADTKVSAIFSFIGINTANINDL